MPLCVYMCVCVFAGMLLAGLVLRNVPYITEAVFIDTHWSAALRNIALSIILTRAGLGLNPSVQTQHTKIYSTYFVIMLMYLQKSIYIYVCVFRRCSV